VHGAAATARRRDRGGIGPLARVFEGDGEGLAAAERAPSAFGLDQCVESACRTVERWPYRRIAAFAFVQRSKVRVITMGAGATNYRAAAGFIRADCVGAT